MRIVNLRSLGFVGLAGVCATALLSTNFGCGSDTGAKTDGGAKGGSGGGAGSGGATGNGGAGGSATGNGGAGGGSVTHLVNYTFDTTVQGWMLNTFFEAANLGGIAPADGGVDAGTANPPVVAFEAADGMPTPGSLKLTATYTAYNQYADVLINPSPGIDLTGKTLHAQVRLVSVTGTGWTGGVQFHASTGPTFVYGNPLGMALTTVGTWMPLTFVLSTIDPATKPGWDPASVVQMGVQFYSGDAPLTNPATFPITAVFEIDTVTD